MSELIGIVRLDFTKGSVEEFKRLVEQSMELVRANEPGTLQHDIYFNADQTRAVSIERYVDSQALIDHAANIGELMGAIAETGSAEGELLGDVSPELRAMIEASPVGLFTLYKSK